MNYAERLSNVTVLGAAGKMGSGITLLTAIEMADLSLDPENKSLHFVLNAVDVSDEALSGLMVFLKTQILKAAEKKAVWLRKVYAAREDLVENEEIINQYVFDALRIVRPTRKIESACDSTLVFEAVNESPDLKVKLLSAIEKDNSKKPWYFTNTSSIPIHVLDERIGLAGRIIGFHFYNPPAVQKLVELIVANTTKPELKDFAYQYAKKLRKKIVPSNDIAGFIGNGHFMRDILHGVSEVEKLTGEGFTFTEAVYMINRISQDYLIRPMGIFQLIDYVGLDVCCFIMSVMNPYLEKENLNSPLLEKLIAQKILGGQFHDGSQKDGFLKYAKGKPVAAYDPEKQQYVDFTEFQAKCDEKLEPPPASLSPWKAVIGNPQKNDLIGKIYAELKEMNSLGAKLAKRYGHQSKAIGMQLVNDNVAQSPDDVNTVLLTGFFHAYGPINDYFESEVKS